jgi:hypothetical protein
MLWTDVDSKPYHRSMPKRSGKQARLPDPAEMAFGVIQIISGNAPAPPADPPPDGKNPAAVALGRLGGLKGGPARAKLGKKKLSELGKKAAAARWKKGRSSE